MSEQKKKYEGVIWDLEYMKERTEFPTYNQLESGFRHTPLTQKEILQRHVDLCQEVHQILSLHLPKLRAMYEDWCNYDDLRNS